MFKKSTILEAMHKHRNLHVAFNAPNGNIKLSNIITHKANHIYKSSKYPYPMSTSAPRLLWIMGFRFPHNRTISDSQLFRQMPATYFFTLFSALVIRSIYLLLVEPTYLVLPCDKPPRCDKRWPFFREDDSNLIRHESHLNFKSFNTG